MDRRNGGDHQAPPRPPKLLPRIHRPRAPEPLEVLNEMPNSRNIVDRRVETEAVGFGTGARSSSNSNSYNTIGPTETEVDVKRTAIPRCINSDQEQHLSKTSVISRLQNENTEQKQQNQQQQQQQQEQLNSITTASATVRTASPTTPVAAATTPTAPKTPVISPVNSISSSSSSNSKSNIHNTNKNDNCISGPGTFVIHNHLLNDPNNLDLYPDYENYQIYHLTYLPQRPSSLSLSSLSSSPAVTAANSFTRRRPQPGTPGADAPWRITGNNSNSNSNSGFGSFFSHFQHADNLSASPVTLAQPRPESQRLTNQYVDTPLRATHHLQNASRNQHPAGQLDGNQTTTHHVLLLPQRDLHQHRIAENIGSTTNTSASATATGSLVGTDGTDGFIHSNSQNQKLQAVGDKQACSPLPPRRDNSTAAQQHQQQLPLPITKQPAAAAGSTKCKSSPGEIPAIQLSNSTASNNSSSIGTPIIIAGSLGSTNSITCPRCGRCRCEQCKSTGLPQKWLCKKTCLCSAETILDYSTCLCCAKAIFYHCATQGDMDDEEDYVDDPCSCTPRKRLQRWGWLGALSIVLPCLWFYWPMRGCTWLCEKCYNRFAGRGCRCQQNTASNMLPSMPMASHGGNNSANSNLQGGNDSSAIVAKSKGGHGHHHHNHHHHHHHHHGESVASRMLRKGDITPEKRLLDTNIDY